MENSFAGPWRKSEPQRHVELPPYLIVVDVLDEIEADGESMFLQDILKTINQRPLQKLKFLITIHKPTRSSRRRTLRPLLCDSFSSKAFCRLQDVSM
jgi:hypothetical protein